MTMGDKEVLSYGEKLEKLQSTFTEENKEDKVQGSQQLITV